MTKKVVELLVAERARSLGVEQAQAKKDILRQAPARRYPMDSVVKLIDGYNCAKPAKRWT